MAVLNDAAVRAAKPFTTIWDTNLRGFGLSTGKAKKSFIVLVGSGRRHTIGVYPLCSLSEARSLARTMLAEKMLGKIRPKHVAFDDARDDFLKDCEPRLRPLTYRLYKRHLTVHFPFGRTSIADITARQIAKQLSKLNDRPSEKEHAHRVGRTFFKWCAQQDLIDRSPMEKMAAPPLSASRDRVLSEAELLAVFRTAWNGEGSFHRLVCLLLLLGLRRTETASLQWDFFDQDNQILTIPGELTKNKRKLVIPYGSSVSAVLDRTPRFSPKYVFPAAREQVRGKRVTIMTGYSKAKQFFDAECGVRDWVLHDCRRTVATGLQRIGARLEVIESLLNHVSGSRAGIVGIYQRYDFQPELRSAVQRWQEYLHALLSHSEDTDCLTETSRTSSPGNATRLHAEREAVFAQQPEL